MAGTVADLLGDMQVLNNELRTGAGEVDEVRAVRALSMAQHFFEAHAATRGRVLGSTINVAQSAQTETTPWPSSLLRLDAVWLLDANGRAIRSLDNIDHIGEHVPSLPWEITLSDSAIGVAGGYVADMESFWWFPLPSGATSIRLYGLIEQPEFATRNSTFGRPLRCKLPLASLAVKLMRMSVDDDTTTVDSWVAATLAPLWKGLQGFDRTGAHARVYTQVHDA